MKATTLLAVTVISAVFSSSSPAQRSNDSWDSIFNPKAVKQRQEQRYQKWLQSWAGRLCAGADVKEFWRFTLTIPTPDTLSSEFHRVLAQNEQLKNTLDSGVVDFDAQDLADQINVMSYRSQGKIAEATALEQTRLERIRIRQQQQFYAEMVARQAAIQAQLTTEMNRLRQEVAAARAAAESAERRH